MTAAAAPRITVRNSAPGRLPRAGRAVAPGHPVRRRAVADDSSRRAKDHGQEQRSGAPGPQPGRESVGRAARTVRREALPLVGLAAKASDPSLLGTLFKTPHPEHLAGI